jgi:hypothetical protein
MAVLATLAVAGWVVPTLITAVPSRADTVDAGAPTRWIGIAAARDGDGYWVVSNRGSVEGYGDAAPHGDMSDSALNQSVVGMAATPNGAGYWLDAADGGIFSFGSANFWGSTGALNLNKPVVGMARTHNGDGYWLVASDGGIFAFGDANFEGSMGGHQLNEPVVGMAPTRDGDGYWLVASDGGIFAFGDARFEGSLGSSPPASPIVYMAPTPDNGGYWLLSQDGTVYAFGDAHNDGSVEGSAAAATSLAATPSGGYWVLTADGSVYSFGDARYYGSPATGPTTAAPTDASTADAPVAAPASTPKGNSGTSGDSGGSGNSGDTPAVSAVSPSSGTAGGGDTVQISGSGFGGATSVDFGSNASSDFTVTSDTTIAAVAPVGAGTVDVRVVTPAGTSNTSSADHFTYEPTGQLPITAQGQNLEIGGVPTKFPGFDAWQLATDWGINYGCGAMDTPAQIDAFFASLRPDSIVRFAAFQGTMATNVHTHQLDWRPLDNVFYAAARYHVYLIPVISNQSATCDGDHWQDLAWYSGGFKDVYNSADNSDGYGLNPLSYWDYMNDLVSRYADSPALGMWEPMSEAEASNCPSGLEESDGCWGHQTCPSETAAASALEYFFTTVGDRIHALDPEHLVEAGLIGGGQCGTSDADYQSVGASSGIDVLSIHDYYGAVPLGGDKWNGVAVRFAQAKALDKPIITGEVGILAGNDQSSCMSMQQRAIDMSAKMNAQFAAGDSAFLVWNWDLDTLGSCTYDTGPTDNSLFAAMEVGSSSG